MDPACRSNLGVLGGRGYIEHPHPAAAVPRGRHCDTRHGRPHRAPDRPRIPPHAGRCRPGGGGSRAVLLGRRAVMKSLY